MLSLIFRFFPGERLVRVAALARSVNWLLSMLLWTFVMVMASTMLSVNVPELLTAASEIVIVMSLAPMLVLFGVN